MTPEEFHQKSLDNQAKLTAMLEKVLPQLPPVPTPDEIARRDEADAKARADYIARQEQHLRAQAEGAKRQERSLELSAQDVAERKRSSDALERIATALEVLAGTRMAVLTDALKEPTP